MATKTVVCSGCGAPAIPGRYACTECGSLLAAVTASARRWGSEPEPDPEPTADEPPTDDPVARPVAPPRAAPLGRAVGPLAPNPQADEDVADSSAVRPAEDWDEPVAGAPAEPGLEPEAGPGPEPEPAPEPEAGPGPDPEPAPVPEPAPEPDVLHGWTPPEGARTEPARTDEPPSGPEPTSADEWVQAAAPPVAPVAPSAPPTWPPAGDRGVHPTQITRTPAGAYLPPSAVLDALDPASAAGRAGRAPSMSPARKAGDSERTSPGVKARGPFGSAEVAEDTPRAVIAIAAAIAAIGFLLPWANVLAGAGLLGGYFTQWGLAGPGHWIALTLLIATVGVALAGPPTARWPVGLGAIALAALLVGMLWPYLFGFLGRSIGIWVVLAGAIVLVVGGVLDRLDRLDRHDPDGPAVP